MAVTTNINNRNICNVTTTRPSQLSSQSSTTTTTTGDLPVSQHKYHCPFARTDSSIQLGLQPATTTTGLPAGCMTSLVRRASVCTETGVDRVPPSGLSRDPFRGSLSCLATIQRRDSIIESLDKKYRENISNRIRTLKPYNSVSSTEQLPVIVARKPPESGTLARLNVSRSANYQNVLASGSAAGPRRRINATTQESINNQFLPARHSTLPTRLDHSQYSDYFNTNCPVELAARQQATHSSCDSLNSSITDDSSDDTSINSSYQQQQQQQQQLDPAVYHCSESMVQEQSIGDNDDSCYLAPPPAIPSSASPPSTYVLPFCLPPMLSLPRLTEPGIDIVDMHCPASNNNLSASRIVAVNNYQLTLPTTQPVTASGTSTSDQRPVSSVYQSVTHNTENSCSGRVYRTALQLSISPSHTTTTRRELVAPVKHVSTFILSPVCHIASPSDVTTPDDDIPPPLPSEAQPVSRSQTSDSKTLRDIERKLQSEQYRSQTSAVSGSIERPVSVGNGGRVGAGGRPGSSGAGVLYSPNKPQSNRTDGTAQSQPEPTLISCSHNESIPYLLTTPAQSTHSDSKTMKHVTNVTQAEVTSQTGKQQALSNNMNTSQVCSPSHSSVTATVSSPVAVPVRVVHGLTRDDVGMNDNNKLQQQQQQQQRTSARPTTQPVSGWSTVASSQQFIYAPTINKKEQQVTTLMSMTSDMTSLSRVIVVPMKKEYETDAKGSRNVDRGHNVRVERSWETDKIGQSTVRQVEHTQHTGVLIIPVHHGLSITKQQQQQCYRDELLQVDINKSCLGLTFCIEGGKDSLDGDRPITVKRVFRPGEVLQVGDQIISVNGKELSMTSHYDAWNYLKSLPEGPLHLVIRRQTY